jgi:hypothetical protein
MSGKSIRWSDILSRVSYCVYYDILLR